MRSNTEQEYYNALQRLLKNKETISLNAIAIEAGKKPGTLRAARFPNLIVDIQHVMEVQAQQLIPHKEPKFEEQFRAKDKKLESLKKDYSIALQRIVSLERQVFALQAELSQHKPQKGVLHELPKHR